MLSREQWMLAVKVRGMMHICQAWMLVVSPTKAERAMAMALTREVLAMGRDRATPLMGAAMLSIPLMQPYPGMHVRVGMWRLSIRALGTCCQRSMFHSRIWRSRPTREGRFQSTRGPLNHPV